MGVNFGALYLDALITILFITIREFSTTKIFHHVLVRNAGSFFIITLALKFCRLSIVYNAIQRHLTYIFLF